MRPLLSLLLVLALALGPSGCGGHEAEIEQVKRASTAGLENEALVKEVAGARGSVEWSAKEASGPGYAQGADIVRVTAHIEKPGASGMRTAEIAWIVNRDTEAIALDGVTIDGKPETLAGGALQILLLRLE